MTLSIVLNDWNNAYSNKNTPLAKRFSELMNKRGRTRKYYKSLFWIPKMDLSWEKREKTPI
jgi:hypothetical protein